MESGGVVRHGIVSMMVVICYVVMCNDIAIIVMEHDERRPELPNAPVVIEHDNNGTEEQSSKHRLSIL